jgi:hypothetical protein
MKIYSGDKKGVPAPTQAPTYMKGDKGDKGDTGVVQEIIAGTNITVDNSDPHRPVIASTGGGGSSSWNLEQW